MPTPLILTKSKWNACRMNSCYYILCAFILPARPIWGYLSNWNHCCYMHSIDCTIIVFNHRWCFVFLTVAGRISSQDGGFIISVEKVPSACNTIWKYRLTVSMVKVSCKLLIIFLSSDLNPVRDREDPPCETWFVILFLSKDLISLITAFSSLFNDSPVSPQSSLVRHHAGRIPWSYCQREAMCFCMYPLVLPTRTITQA